jgi:hypothetical protein
MCAGAKRSGDQGVRGENSISSRHPNWWFSALVNRPHKVMQPQ